MRARREELVGAVFARVSGGAFGVVGAQDAEYLAGLRAAVVAAVEHGLDGIERGEGWVGAIPPAVSEQARRAARMGVSLETVLRRYVVGHTLMGEFVLEEAARGETLDERGALRDALRAQASVLDRLLETITSEYEDELARVGRSPERRRYELVQGLLAGGDLAQGAELDYELGGWHLGVVAVGGEDGRAGADGRVGEVVRALAAGLDSRLLSVAHGRDGVWAWLGGGRDRRAFAEIELVLASMTWGDGVVADGGVMADEGTVVGGGLVAGGGAVAGGGVVLAVGEPARGIEGWRLTHRQARAALVVALHRPRRLTRYADVALLAMALKDQMLARGLVDLYVSPLDDDTRNGGAVLRETLRAYLTTERNASSAAAVLGVARSTVEKRLRTIEERLGRPLHPCPAELEVALELDAIGIATIAENPIGEIAG